MSGREPDEVIVERMLLADAEKALKAMMSMKPHKWLCECSACIHAHETHDALVRALACPEKAAPTPLAASEATILDKAPNAPTITPSAADDLERARTILRFPRGYLTHREAELLMQLVSAFAAIRAEAKAEGWEDAREQCLLAIDALVRPSPTGRES